MPNNATLDMIPLIRQYLATQPIQRAYLFGSYSRGEETPDSDVDLLVDFVPGETIGLKYPAMVCDLEDILHKDVDMVVNGSLLPFAVASAERDKILIYERAS